MKAAFAPPDRLRLRHGHHADGAAVRCASGDCSAGDPVQIVEQIGMNVEQAGQRGSRCRPTACSRTGSGAARRSPDTVLTWFDRTGKPIGTLGTARGIPQSADFSGRHSRGGRACATMPISSVDLWVLDMARKVPTKLTFAAANSVNIAPLGHQTARESHGRAASPRARQPTIFHKRIGEPPRMKKSGDCRARRRLTNGRATMGILFHDGGIPPRAPGLQILPLDGGEPRMLGDARIDPHARAHVSTGWPLDCIHVDRYGSSGNLRAELSDADRAYPGFRQWRHPTAVAARRPRAVFSGARWDPDGCLRSRCRHG